MKDEEILRLGDLNLAEYIREMARWNAAGEIVEANDLVLTHGPNRFPVTSVAMNLAPEQDEAGEDVFNRIKSFYRERKSGFSIHVRTHADCGLANICKREGLVQISNAAGMVLDGPLPPAAGPDGPNGPNEPNGPNGIDLRIVSDAAGVVDLAKVSSDSYQSLDLPPFVCKKIFAFPERLLTPHNCLVVAYDSGEPFSAAMVLLSHGIAGIYWVGTVQSARGRGLAEACVRRVTHEALRRGASLVVLQASKFGEPLYRRMGFREVTRYPYFLCFDHL